MGLHCGAGDADGFGGAAKAVLINNSECYRPEACSPRKDEARGIGLGYQFCRFVGDSAFDIADGATALDDVALGAQFGDANGTQEIDFEFDSGERFAWREVLAKAMPMAASAMSQSMPP